MIARKDPASALPPLRRRVIVAPRPRQLSGETNSAAGDMGVIVYPLPLRLRGR